MQIKRPRQGGAFFCVNIGLHSLRDAHLSAHLFDSDLGLELFHSERNLFFGELRLLHGDGFPWNLRVVESLYFWIVIFREAVPHGICLSDSGHNEIEGEWLYRTLSDVVPGAFTS
jgi:hypothetical protein